MRPALVRVSVGKWAFVWWIASKISSTLSINFPFRIYLLLFFLLCPRIGRRYVYTHFGGFKCERHTKKSTRVYKKFITPDPLFAVVSQKRTAYTNESLCGDDGARHQQKRNTTQNSDEIVSRSIKICHISAIILWSNCVLVSHLLLCWQISLEFNKFPFRFNVASCSSSFSSCFHHRNVLGEGLLNVVLIHHLVVNK